MFEAPFRKDRNLERMVKKVIRGVHGDEAKARALFQWILREIPYDSEQLHRINQWQPLCYRDSLDTFYDRKGVCGEQSYLFVTMARLAGLQAWFVQVDETRDGLGFHACAAVELDSLVYVDPAYKTWDVRHRRTRIVDMAVAQRRYRPPRFGTSAHDASCIQQAREPFRRASRQVYELVGDYAEAGTSVVRRWQSPAYDAIDHNVEQAYDALRKAELAAISAHVSRARRVLDQTVVRAHEEEKLEGIREERAEDIMVALHVTGHYRIEACMEDPSDPRSTVHIFGSLPSGSAIFVTLEHCGELILRRPPGTARVRSDAVEPILDEIMSDAPIGTYLQSSKNHFVFAAA